MVVVDFFGLAQHLLLLKVSECRGRAGAGIGGETRSQGLGPGAFFSGGREKLLRKSLGSMATSGPGATWVTGGARISEGGAGKAAGTAAGSSAAATAGCATSSGSASMPGAALASILSQSTSGWPSGKGESPNIQAREPPLEKKPPLES